jgi:hypothetical protein
MHGVSASLGVPCVTRVVYQNAADHLRAQCKEVDAVFAPDALGANQFQIRFVGQCSRFQRVIGSAAQVLSRDPSEFRIDCGDHVFDRLLVSVAPGHE